ncbi:hypothetical protein [Nonomuraea sp. 10N515B]|uniref:hypothetical protein n=1 Tax=Nonomuraea sp. 10N515B TaxID=3457422 RepID=UPI003FCDC2F3
MTARDPDMSIEEHLSGENRLIGASKSKNVARGFAVGTRDTSLKSMTAQTAWK